MAAEVSLLVRTILILALSTLLPAQASRESPARIRCRILDANDRPIAHENVTVFFRQARELVAATVTSDGNGILDVAVPLRLSLRAGGEVFVVRAGQGSASEITFVGSKGVPLTRLMRRGARLEDARLEPGRLLAAGRVIDTDGRAIAGARIEAENIRGAFAARRSLGRDRCGISRTTTDADGKFALHATDIDASPRTLVVTRAGFYATAGDRIEFGTTAARVVMTRTSSIFGRILGVPRDRPFPGLITVRDEKGKESQRLFAFMAPKGMFTIEGCLPGTYSVAFQFTAAARPFRVVRRVKVRAGKPCRDPRLASIDASKHGRMVRVTALDPGGDPIAGANPSICIMHPTQGHVGWGGGGRTNSRGIADLVLPAEGANIAVRAAGYKNRRFAMLTKDTVVRLRKAMQVTLVIDGLPHLPKDFHFVVFARKHRPQIRLEDDWGWLKPDNADLRVVASKAVFNYDETGAYDVTLIICCSLDMGQWPDMTQATVRSRILLAKQNYAGAGEYVVKVPLNERNREKILCNVHRVCGRFR